MGKLGTRKKSLVKDKEVKWNDPQAVQFVGQQNDETDHLFVPTVIKSEPLDELPGPSYGSSAPVKIVLLASNQKQYYTCGYCELAFNDPSDVQRHLEVHKRGNDYVYDRKVNQKESMFIPPKVKVEKTERPRYYDVEKRRRNRISSYITQLCEIVPTAGCDTVKGKGDILERAYDYILQLQEDRERLELTTQEHTKLSLNLQTITGEKIALEKQNQILLSLLKRNGIEFNEDEVWQVHGIKVEA